MTAYSTRGILAVRYLKAGTHCLTHVLADSATHTLCKRIPETSLADVAAADVKAPATCPVCRKRDPRHPNAGPLALENLLNRAFRGGR
jgi:hypothetical protein